MKRLLDVLIYISFFAAAVSFIALIISHFMDATPLNTSPRAVAGFSFMCLVWVIALDIIDKRLAAKK